MKRADAYLGRKLLGTFGAALTALGGLLLAFMWVRHGDLEAATWGSLVYLEHPLALAGLAAGLLVYRELAEAGELDAFRAAGISLARLMAPALLLGAALLLGVGACATELAPRARAALRALQRRDPGRRGPRRATSPRGGSAPAGAGLGPSYRLPGPAVRWWLAGPPGSPGDVHVELREREGGLQVVTRRAESGGPTAGEVLQVLAGGPAFRADPGEPGPAPELPNPSELEEFAVAPGTGRAPPPDPRALTAEALRRRLGELPATGSRGGILAAAQGGRRARAALALVLVLLGAGLGVLLRRAASLGACLLLAAGLYLASRLALGVAGHLGVLGLLRAEGAPALAVGAALVALLGVWDLLE